MLRELAPFDRISPRADRPIQTIGRRQAVILAVVSSGGVIFLTFCAWYLRHQNSDSVTATLVLGFLIVLVMAIRGGQTAYSVLDPLLLFSALITPLVLVDESVSGNMNLLLTRLAATLCVVGLIRLFVTHVPAARHQEPA